MSVRPLARWAILQQWTLRYTERGDEIVSGVFTTPAGSIPFHYEREARLIHLPDRVVQLDEYGWEVNPAGRTTFHSSRRVQEEADDEN